MASSSRVRLTQIAPEAYRHPHDQQATRTLRAVPGFEKAIAYLSRHSFERFLYHEYCASAVKVGPRQCPRIHVLLEEACDTLDMPLPSLFLAQTPIANAFAFGRETPTLVLQTGLVELLSEDELRAVIAHELGHVHCGHSIYRLMWLLLVLASRFGGGQLGVGDLFSMPLQLALLEWMRKAEFSADRAAILGVQDAEVVFSALFKLTGGSPRVFEQMDRDEYLKQAELYAPPVESRLDRFYKMMLETEKTHPIPVLRAREALEWGKGEAYQRIVAGQYLRRDTLGKGAASVVSCPSCGEETEAGFSFCTRCGRDLPAPGALPPAEEESDV